MVRLKSILSEFAEKPLVLGKGESQEPNVIELRKNLDSFRKNNNKYFRILASMVFVCFAVSLILLVMFKKDTALLTAIYGATGISIGWSVKMMHKIWKEKNQSDMLYSLIDHLDNQTLQSVAAILTKSLYSSD